MKKEDKEKISHLFKQEMLSGLRHHYIKKDSSGISVFGNYHITKTKDGCYRVKQRSWMENRDFISVKTAMSYCVLHNSKRTDSAVKLYQLDCRLSSINLDIKIHTKGYKTKKNSLDLRLIQLTKLEEDYMKKKQILLEIQKHINTSKNEQTKIFETYKKTRYKNIKNSTPEDKYIYSSTDY